jgi:hypothetical protein
LDIRKEEEEPNLKTMEKISTAEKISIGLSVAALALSIVSPIATYLWLDPQFQAYRNRPVLQAFPTPKPPKTFAVGESINISELWTDQEYSLNVLNVGKLPAKEVIITARSAVNAEYVIQTNPPIQYEVNKSPNGTFIKLLQAIPPNSTVTIHFSPSPDLIWVANNEGDQNLLKTDAEFARFAKAAKTVDLHRTSKP